MLNLIIDKLTSIPQQVVESTQKIKNKKRKKKKRNTLKKTSAGEPIRATK